MALISYAPAGLAGVAMINGNKTLGPTLAVTKITNFSPTAGTVPANQLGSYPLYGMMGKVSDQGEIADCLNQLVSRIQALEAILGLSNEYGIIPT